MSTVSGPALQIRVPAKIILAGEHAVVRGFRAVAMPFPKFEMILESQSAPAWSLPEGLEVFFWEAGKSLAQAWERPEDFSSPSQVRLTVLFRWGRASVHRLHCARLL